MKAIIKLAVIFFIVAVAAISYTGAKFSKSVIITGNSVSTGTWETEPDPGIQPGDVIINEVMWMGSDTSSADQWIELRNTTDESVDIGGWKIENALATNGTLTIGSGRIIPANGYFLISRYPNGGTGSNSDLKISPSYIRTDLNLSNGNNGHLALKDDGGNEIDSAKGDTWPAGYNGSNKQSMQRKNTPGDGLLPENWFTCEAAGCAGGTFWKTADGSNYGTPGAVNIAN